MFAYVVRLLILTLHRRPILRVATNRTRPAADDATEGVVFEDLTEGRSTAA